MSKEYRPGEWVPYYALDPYATPEGRAYRITPGVTSYTRPLEPQPWEGFVMLNHAQLIEVVKLPADFLDFTERSQ